MSRFLRNRQRSQRRSLDWQGIVRFGGLCISVSVLLAGLWKISQEESSADSFAWIIALLGAINVLLVMKLLLDPTSRAYLYNMIVFMTDSFQKANSRWNPIIDQPGLQSKRGKWIDFLLSLFLWVFFFVLFSQVFEAVLWSLDLTEFSGSPYFLMTIKATASMLGWAAIVACIAFAIMLFWTQWNFWHYGLLNRRKFLPPVTKTELADHFGMTTRAVETAQSLKISYVEPTEQGPVFRERSSQQKR